MSSYFVNLLEENVIVLHQLIKHQTHKLKVAESFEWFKYIKNHPEKNWNYDLMCSNDYDFMCENPNITWDIIQKFPLATNIYRYFSSNPNITIELVNQYLSLWDYKRLAKKCKY